jgi:hypothetical protein
LSAHDLTHGRSERLNLTHEHSERLNQHYNYFQKGAKCRKRFRGRPEPTSKSSSVTFALPTGRSSSSSASSPSYHVANKSTPGLRTSRGGQVSRALPGRVQNFWTTRMGEPYWWLGWSWWRLFIFKDSASRRQAGRNNRPPCSQTNTTGHLRRQPTGLWT